MAAQSSLSSSWSWLSKVLARRARKAKATPVRSAVKRHPREGEGGGGREAGKMRRKSRLRLTSHLGSGGWAGRRGGLFDRLLGSFDHVADAAHGLDELLRVAVVDLAAQVADVDVDDVGEAVVIHIPDVLDDHGAAEGAALVAHHVFEDAKFLRGEVDGFGAADNLAADAIQGEFVHL